MDVKGLKVFRIFLKDKHDTNKVEQYLCIAKCTERAIGLTKNHAESKGWNDFEVDQVTCVGDLNILDVQFYGECEVAKCLSSN